MWVPPEIKDPILRHAPTRKSASCFGAVSLDTGQFVRMMCPIFNAATFKTFLRRLLRQQTPGRRMIVVLDTMPDIITQGSWQHSCIAMLDSCA